jgi:4-amino-4-deoxy-L-arabinose transferase-like glycosyltransferase
MISYDRGMIRPDPPRRDLGSLAALALVLVAALALRLYRLREGLPDFTDEAFPFRRAFEMGGWETGHADWNPRAFHYPSLSFYLFLAIQELQFAAGRLLGFFRSPGDFFLAYTVDPTALVTVGRLVGVACQLATIAGVVRVGESLRRGAGLVAGGLLAVSPMMLIGTRGIGVDAPMTAFSVWAFERMLAYRESGSLRALAASAVFLGLGAGTKYTAALLVVPLAWAVLSRGDGWPRRWLLATLGAAAAFLATSPFLLVERGRVASDALKISSLLSSGQLGSPGESGVWFYIVSLARDIGPVGVTLLALSPLVSIAAHPASRRGNAGRDRTPWLGLWLFFLAFALPPIAGNSGLARYLVPALPGAALLAALAASVPFEWAPRLAGKWPRVALVAALVLPTGLEGLRIASAGGDTTQARARRWLEANVPDSALVVQEAYAAKLRACPETARIRRSAGYRSADARWRARFEAQRTMHAVELPLVVGGRGAVAVPAAGGAVRYVDLWPSAADVNAVFYAPELYGAADYVVTSGAVRGRYEAEAARHEPAMAFYRWLDADAEPVARFAAGGGVTGPEIRVYRLGERARRGAARAFDPLWWASFVPVESRRALEAAIAPARPAEDGVRDETGRPAIWVGALGGMFDQQIVPFAYAMAGHLAELRRLDDARGFAAAIVVSGDPRSPAAQAARAILGSADSAR